MTDNAALRWPSSTDYTNVVQQTTTAFADPLLRDAQLTMTPFGLPAVASGQNVVVFQMQTAAGVKAVRCFINAPEHGLERYGALAAHLAATGPTKLSTAAWIEQGVNVRGHWWPVVVMPWESGRPLTSVVEDRLGEPGALAQLADQWTAAVLSIQAAQVAHGDLQHGNVLVTDDFDLRFVDLDGAWVPGAAGGAPEETGHPNYQHPGRSARHWGPYVDTFSAELIRVSLHALDSDPTLERFLGGENLVLTRSDLVSPGATPAWSALLNNPDPRVQAGTERLLAWCNSPEPVLIPFADVVDHAALQSASSVRPAVVAPTDRDSVMPASSSGDAAWWSSPSTQQPDAAMSAPGGTATVTSSPASAPSAQRRGAAGLLAGNLVISGAIGGAAAGLVGSAAQGALITVVDPRAAPLIFVSLIGLFLGAVINGWQSIAVRGLGGSMGRLAIGGVVGAVASSVGVIVADVVSSPLLPESVVENAPLVGLLWAICAGFIGASIGALRSARAAVGGASGGVLGGAVGGVVHGATTARFDDGLLAIDGWDAGTIVMATLVSSVIGMSIGLMVRVVRRASLRIVEGRGAGVELTLDRPIATIGSSRSATLTLPSSIDGPVLDLHVRLNFADGGATVDALGPILVNGAPFSGQGALSSGSVLFIGSSFVRVDHGEESS